MTRIMIVDDHPIFLEGLKTFLTDCGHNVVQASRSVAEALACFAEINPDVLIADMALGDGTGLELLEAVREYGSKIPIILLTAQIGPADARAALSNGVNGLILKDASPDIVLRCIETVQLGHNWIDQGIMDSVMSKPEPAGNPAAIGALTSTEIIVAKAVADGLRNRDIAIRLGIAEGTVKVHLHNIFQKLGLKSRSELAVFAIQHAA